LIKKKHILETLYKALDSEEEANDQFFIYTINSLKYYKWLSDDKKEIIVNIMTRLRDDTQKHATKVGSLINQIKESEKNKF
jgi:hypothetical protein